MRTRKRTDRRHSSTHSLTSALDGGEWSASRPRRFCPREWKWPLSSIYSRGSEYVELYFHSRIRSVPMKFPEWSYCKRIRIRRAYWKESHSKHSPWAAMNLAQRCYLPLLKRFLELLLWNSFHCRRQFFFLDVTPQSVVEVKNAWSCISTPPVCLHGVVLK
jgi:hypothetical protein